MEADYTKRELDEHFKNMNARFDKQDIQLGEIKVQTIKTNGRVNKLESRWSGIVIGGTIITFLIGIIMSLVVYSFKLSQDNLRQSILIELRK